MEAPKPKNLPEGVDAGTFRKLPVEVTAWLIKQEIVCHTLEGDMTGNVGDWLIKGVNGELYPCKPDVFAATYEFVRP